jgi:hypothetical protein
MIDLDLPRGLGGGNLDAAALAKVPKFHSVKKI